eukprot:SAG31_NODE_948_length_10825_cov_9.412829_4_plen_56_part_00
MQLFEKCGTLIERNTALIEKVSPCREFYNLSCKTRDDTEDKCLHDAVAGASFIVY